MKAIKNFSIDKKFGAYRIAGFEHGDGAQVMEHLKIGAPLQIFAEVDNPFDPFAVVVYFGDKKLGYIPRDKNEQLHKLLRFGHADIFEVFVNRREPEKHPEQQIGIVIKIKEL
jgi:succinate dehydrogenase flavin-adding protein (antitoxin of CptAB toxin-antitoxin module)